MDWNYWLGRKYDIMQQGQDTARQGMQADANLTNVRAGLLPAQTKADIGLTSAQALLANANARNVDETTRYVGPIANSGIALNRAQIGNLGAESAYTGQRSSQLEQLNRLGLSIGDRFRLGALLGD